MLAVILFQIKKFQTPTEASLINHALTDAFIHIPQFWKQSLKTEEHFFIRYFCCICSAKGLQTDQKVYFVANSCTGESKYKSMVQPKFVFDD